MQKDAQHAHASFFLPLTPTIPLTSGTTPPPFSTLSPRFIAQPVNPLTFQLLEGEEALLVHGCGRQATRQEWRRYNRHGKLIVFVRATALDPTGENLGNYHTGRCLSDRALAFLKSGRTPFQFEREVEGVIPGKLILLNPSQEPGAGDATEVDFTVEHALVDLEVTEFPGGSVATPGETETFVTLPEQAVASLTAECLTALLEAVFLNENAFASAPLTLTLHDGDPAGAGTAVSDALPLTDWANVDEPETGSRPPARNHEQLEFLDASGLDRTVSQLLWSRNGVPVAMKELSSPITIPGYQGLRVPVNTLALQLTWPQASDMASSWTEHPARAALRFLFGIDTLQPAETTLYVNCYDGDPHASGLPVAHIDLSIARSAAGWTTAGSDATSAAAITGVATAPVGGWTIPLVVAGNSVNGWRVVQEFSPPLFVPEGGVVNIPLGESRCVYLVAALGSSLILKTSRAHVRKPNTRDSAL
jgi:hypothetical protein